MAADGKKASDLEMCHQQAGIRWPKSCRWTQTTADTLNSVFLIQSAKPGPNGRNPAETFLKGHASYIRGPGLSNPQNLKAKSGYKNNYLLEDPGAE
jgi:hypothetical protein